MMMTMMVQASITFDRFSLGNVPPVLTNFRVYKTKRNEEIVWDFDMVWKTGLDVRD